MWPQDPAEFNRILDRYKASKDAAVPGFQKRNFSLSDFYEAKKKKDDDVDDDDGDDEEDEDDDHVDPKLQKPGNKQISEDKYPTWDARIDLFSEDELIKLIASLKAKIQASTLKIDSMERYKHYAAKQNQNLSRSESSSKTTRRLKPANWPFNKNSGNTTRTSTSALQSNNPMSTTSTSSASAMESKPPLPVTRPLLPSAWILSSESHKKI